MQLRQVQISRPTNIAFGTAASVGAIAGSLVAIPDIIMAARSLGSTEWVPAVAFRILLTDLTFTLGISLLSAFILFILHLFQRKHVRSIPPRQVSLAMTCCGVPWLMYLSIQLFKGGFASRLPAVPVLIGITFLLLAGVLFVGVRGAIFLLERLDKISLSPRHVAVCAGFIALAFVMRWCDAHLYKRLYLYIHTTLSWATLGLVLLAVRVVIRPQRERGVQTWVGGVLLVGTMAAILYATVHPLSLQVVRMAASENTATTASLFDLLPWNRIQSPMMSIAFQEKSNPQFKRGVFGSSVSKDFPTFPNAHLILISVDALRADRIGSYGYQQRKLTPNIDQLAANATRFDYAYCSAPHSSFSITSFHTSQNTHLAAQIGKSIEAPTIAQVLQRQGYQTVGLYTQGIFYTKGEAVEQYRDNKLGFEQVEDVALPAERMSDKAITHLEKIKSQGEPLVFLWVHYFNVHDPYRSTRFGDEPADRYDGEIQQADEAIGRLISYIDTRLTKESVIVLLADHGEEFNDHGGYYHGSSLYDEQVRVPFIVRVPNGEGRVVKQPVSLLDSAPTMLGLLGAPVPIGMSGQDLRAAVFFDELPSPLPPVFATVTKQHMVVSWPWKLIADPSKGRYQLFQLQDDPLEKNNLYDTHSHRARQLEASWQGWMDHVLTENNSAVATLNMGKLGDSRAVPALLMLARDTTANDSYRCEALNLLAGIHDWHEPEKIIDLLDSQHKKIAISAASVLASMDDNRGVPLLLEGLKSDSMKLRHASALALGRLGDKSAAPELIQMLSDAEDVQIRKRAIRFLGSLGDRRAVEPLIKNLSELKTRSMTMLALGQLKDSRAIDPILGILEKEKYLNIRGYAVMALGRLGAKETAPYLMRVLREEPNIEWTSQSLLATGAIEQGLIAGADISEQKKKSSEGFATCGCAPDNTVIAFPDNTYCTTQDNRASVYFRTKAFTAQTVIVRLRSVQKETKNLSAAIELDGKPVGTIVLDNKMKAYRLDIQGMPLSSGEHEIRVTTEYGTFEWDHVLVVPTAPEKTN